jgi:hypothetical protein
MNDGKQVKWPWRDPNTGYDIKPGLFYGVGDSGSMYGANFETRFSCLETIMKNHELRREEISLTPDDLGAEIVVIMSGIEYVSELQKRGLIDQQGNEIE